MTKFNPKVVWILCFGVSQEGQKVDYVLKKGKNSDKFELNWSSFFRWKKETKSTDKFVLFKGEQR